MSGTHRGFLLAQQRREVRYIRPDDPRIAILTTQTPSANAPWPGEKPRYTGGPGKPVIDPQV